MSADTPNSCTQPTCHSCNNLISSTLQNPSVGRHHTNLHSADTEMIVTMLYSPCNPLRFATFLLPFFASLLLTSLHLASLHLTSLLLTSLHLASLLLTSLHLASLLLTSLHLASLFCRIALQQNKPPGNSRGLALYDNLFRLSD